MNAPVSSGRNFDARDMMHGRVTYPRQRTEPLGTRNPPPEGSRPDLPRDCAGDGGTVGMKTFRHAVRPTKQRADGVRGFRLGVTVGYWPCVSGIFVQLYVGFWVHDFWYGLESYKKKA